MQDWAPRYFQARVGRERKRRGGERRLMKRKIDRERRVERTKVDFVPELQRL